MLCVDDGFSRNPCQCHLKSTRAPGNLPLLAQNMKELSYHERKDFLHAKHTRYRPLETIGACPETLGNIRKPSDLTKCRLLCS